MPEILADIKKPLSDTPGTSFIEGQLGVMPTSGRLAYRIEGGNDTRQWPNTLELASTDAGKGLSLLGLEPIVGLSAANGQAAIAELNTKIDVLESGRDFQNSVLDRQVDNTLDPGATPSTGDRYLIENSASLHANFGTIAGLGDDDIVEYNGSDFVIAWDASGPDAKGATVYVEDEEKQYTFNAVQWVITGGTLSHNNLLDVNGSSEGYHLSASDFSNLTGGNPSFTGLALSGLTANRLLSNNGVNSLVSTNLIDWVSGTNNQVNVSDDGDGSITLSLPQDLNTFSQPTFANLTIDNLAANRVVGTTGSKQLTTYLTTGSGDIILSIGPTLQDPTLDGNVTLGDLTANSAVYLNASKRLVSQGYTGSGDFVRADFSSLSNTSIDNLTVTGNLITPLGLGFAYSGGSGSALSVVGYTGSGNVVRSSTPFLNTPTISNGNLQSPAISGVATIAGMVDGGILVYNSGFVSQNTFTYLSNVFTYGHTGLAISPKFVMAFPQSASYNATILMGDELNEYCSLVYSRNDNEFKIGIEGNDILTLDDSQNLLIEDGDLYFKTSQTIYGRNGVGGSYHNLEYDAGFHIFKYQGTEIFEIGSLGIEVTGSVRANTLNSIGTSVLALSGNGLTLNTGEDLVLSHSINGNILTYDETTDELTIHKGVTSIPSDLIPNGSRGLGSSGSPWFQAWVDNFESDTIEPQSSVGIIGGTTPFDAIHVDTLYIVDYSSGAAFYGKQDFTATWDPNDFSGSGPFQSLCHAVRIGDRVTLSIGTFSGTSNQSYLGTTSGNGVPLGYRPAVKKMFQVVMKDDDNDETDGYLEVNTNGTLVLYNDSFDITTSGDKGLAYEIDVTYNVL